MVSPRPKIKFTYEDYRNTPEDKRYELIDGDLLVVPAPKFFHQRISIRLAIRLGLFVENSGVGTTSKSCPQARRNETALSNAHCTPVTE